MTNRYDIVPATDGAWLDEVRDVFAEYGRAVAALAGASLSQQGFDSELASLPGKYAPPLGNVYLAIDESAGSNRPRVAGCIALRPLKPIAGRDNPAAKVGEVKRMYVRPEYQRRGIGRMLAEELIAYARLQNYTLLRLDTSSTMQPAINLYRALGFVPCERYNDDPMDDTLYFELAF